MARAPTRKRETVFLGAGFSRSVGLPNTAELLTEVDKLAEREGLVLRDHLQEAYRYFYPEETGRALLGAPQGGGPDDGAARAGVGCTRLRPPRQPIRLITALVALLALGLVLAACGGGSGGAPAGGGPPGHNEADVAFLHLVTPHHEHGIEMAMLAERRATAPEVKALAKRIGAAQEHENTEMRKLLEEFGATEGPVVPIPKKAVEEREMNELKEAPPKELDHLFLESMMAHHMAAVDLAEFELKAGRSPEVKHLAQSMKDLQVKEAEEMQRLLTGSG